MAPDVSVPFVDLQAQRLALAGAVEDAIANALEEGDFILGRAVAEFEAAFAAYCEARFAVGVDSGTSAIELILRALGVGAGDEVIVPANTFIASALPVSAVGARPVLVDVDAETGNVVVEQVAPAIGPRTRAVMVVHLYGQPAPISELRTLCDERGLFLVEDACQAHGARYGGRRVGSFGHAAAFSFYPAKNLGAYGDGGAAVTDDPELAERLLLLRNYGSLVKYHHLIKGYNHRLDTLQAAILLAKLPHLDAWNEARRGIAARYGELLRGLPLTLPGTLPGSDPVHHLYVIRSGERDRLQEHLSGAGVATGIHYPVPIHLQPAYADLGYRPGAFPVTEEHARTILSLPIYAELPGALVERVAAAVAGFYAGTSAREHAEMRKSW